MSASHRSPAADTLAHLAATIRTLWASEPVVGASHREDTVFLLLELKTDVERLSLRHACGTLGPEDLGEIRNCADRLARIERHWTGAAAVPTEVAA